MTAPAASARSALTFRVRAACAVAATLLGAVEQVIGLGKRALQPT